MVPLFLSSGHLQ
uniref:Uncharacterized protein n=1 Tax=Rhizophora mucronata TaxID=61149 RepID=A0A2P2QWW4_RHIMU